MVLTQEKIKNYAPIGKKPKKSSFIPRKQYEESEMMAAIDAVKNGTPAKKKKETQSKKQYKTAAKKAKHAEETTSSEEDEWEPDDESDYGEIGVDESDNVDLGGPENDERTEKSNHPITSCDETDEMLEEIELNLSKKCYMDLIIDLHQTTKELVKETQAASLP
ncbi:hypothetical protein GE061_012978 [Apolygus lucorum]|uniref:Uncharacterized protein n=1 Tax=Apolygus lucorum TaxID=248454 RepID=A0A8S9XXW9_APOLU|nr:hypothetical protein GE061_012978 [Apolygus lucorum]